MLLGTMLETTKRCSSKVRLDQRRSFALPNQLLHAETAGMLIMQTSYVMATGDTEQLALYYNVFRSWGIFLESEALYPRDQVSSDDFQGVRRFRPIHCLPVTLTLDNQNIINSTNLAVKGIVGIGAMAKLAGYMNKSDDVTRFQVC